MPLQEILAGVIVPGRGVRLAGLLFCIVPPEIHSRQEAGR